jgi:hypothetical protein
MVPPGQTRRRANCRTRSIISEPRFTPCQKAGATSSSWTKGGKTTALWCSSAVKAPVFVAWGAAARNGWFQIPQDAATGRLGTSSPNDPQEPGPLADADRVVELRKAAGLVQVRADTVDTVPTPPAYPATAARFASGVEPAARVINEENGSEEGVRVIETEIAEGLRPFLRNGSSQVLAQVHLFFAERPERVA